MINPKSNRLNYAELLTPPEGYQLSKAIGTTYSLDLYALLAIPVAMFYARSLEGDFQQNRYDVLDAIRQSKEKVDLFCQKGKIQVPNDYKSLLAFMEDCVEEVTPPIVKSSFHPKLWVLYFKKGNESFFRLIVLSRNLTFDRSWDIAFFTEGKPGKKNTEAHQLSQYLEYFYKNTKRNIPPTVLEKLSTVEFDCPDGFFDLNIFPILGFNNNIKKYPNPLENNKYEHLLIISPFVDNKTIEKLLENNTNIFLFSREEELDKLDDTLITKINKEEKRIFCLNNVIVEGEDQLDTEGMTSSSQNLHAKIFIGQNGKNTDWYMGSANCTAPAFERNAEALVSFSSDKMHTDVATVKNMLLNEDNKFFQEYERTEIEGSPEDTSQKDQLREFCHLLISTKITGTISKRANGDNYDMFIETDWCHINQFSYDVKAQLIHQKKGDQALLLGQYNKLKFENIALTNLSQFLRLNIYIEGKEPEKLLIKIDVDLPEEREDTIFNNLINSKVKFFQYLQFLLSPEIITNVIEIPGDTDNNIQNSNEELNGVLGMNNAIYESLMLAASRSPHKLKEIDAIVTRLQKLNSEIITDFLPIWTVFKEFANA